MNYEHDDPTSFDTDGQPDWKEPPAIPAGPATARLTKLEVRKGGKSGNDVTVLTEYSVEVIDDGNAVEVAYTDWLNMSKDGQAHAMLVPNAKKLASILGTTDDQALAAVKYASNHEKLERLGATRIGKVYSVEFTVKNDRTNVKKISPL